MLSPSMQLPLATSAVGPQQDCPWTHPTLSPPLLVVPPASWLQMPPCRLIPHPELKTPEPLAALYWAPSYPRPEVLAPTSDLLPPQQPLGPQAHSISTLWSLSHRQGAHWLLTASRGLPRSLRGTQRSIQNLRPLSPPPPPQPCSMPSGLPTQVPWRAGWPRWSSCCFQTSLPHLP